METAQDAVAVAFVALTTRKEENRSTKKYPEHIAASDILNLLLVSFDFKFIAVD